MIGVFLSEMFEGFGDVAELEIDTLVVFVLGVTRNAKKCTVVQRSFGSQTTRSKERAGRRRTKRLRRTPWSFFFLLRWQQRNERQWRN